MSTSLTPGVTEESKYGYFEIFNDKSITKVYHNITNHNPNKKYDSKIALKVIDTIVLDNGQFMFWTFTNKSGYVMKKSMKKLNRDYLINYMMDYINNHLEKAEGIITKKTSSQLLWDVNKYAQMLLERKKDNNARIFTEFENKYLDKLTNLKFILMHYSPTDKRFFNIYQFKEVLDDTSLLANVNMIQFYFYANFKFKPLICKYTRKSALDAKKFNLFSENPIKKGSNTTKTNFKLKDTKSIDAEENESLVLLNNSNLCDYIEVMVTPLIKLIEKSKGIVISEAYFKLIKVKDFIISDIESTKNSSLSQQISEKNHIDFYKYAYCSKIKILSKINLEDEEVSLKDRLNEIRLKKIPKDSAKENESSKPIIKGYEKIFNDAYCFGEFCEYQVPKFFKNLKKTKEGEINTTKIPNENKFSERDSKHNLPNSLPVFILKKAYDNAKMVNIVLKAYSVFPSNFDKDQAIRELNRIKRIEEDRKKDGDKHEIKNNENLSNKVSFKLPEIGNKQIHTESSEKDTFALYKPTPRKFDNINYDSMYTHRGVCNTCFIIYNLIRNFISNIDETTYQFKSLSKAKALLTQGDHLKNPNEEADEYEDNNNDNLFLNEEKNDFNLKTILKKKLLNLKKDALKKRKNKLNNRFKIDMSSYSKPLKYKKAFCYDMNINPKLLRLSLIAEKTKNKFFNLIFDEMKSEPESVYQKLGIKKPDSDYNSSMPILRLHMGLNSSSYKIDNQELHKLNKKINDSLLRDFMISNLSRDDQVISELKNDSMIKKGSSIRGGFQENANEISQYDIDLFLQHKNLIRLKTGIGIKRLNSKFIKKSTGALGSQSTIRRLSNKNMISEEGQTALRRLSTKNREEFGFKQYTSTKTITNTDNKENNNEDIPEMDSNNSLEGFLGEYEEYEDSDFISESESNREDSNSFIVGHKKRQGDLSLIESEAVSSDDESEMPKHEFHQEVEKKKDKKEILSRSLFENDNHHDNFGEDVIIHRKRVYSINQPRHFIMLLLNIEPENLEDSVETKSNKSIMVTGAILKRQSTQTLSKFANKNQPEEKEMEELKEQNQHNEQNDKVLVQTQEIKRRESTTNSENLSGFKKLSNKVNVDVSSNYEMSRKTAVSSIFYYDWSKDLNKQDNSHYYYISSPMIKLNEVNNPVFENPLTSARTMSQDDYVKMGNFDNPDFIYNSQIFVYDQFTAVPYKIVNIKGEELVDKKKSSSSKGTKSNLLKKVLNKRGSTAIFKDNKSSKVVFIILNDFYDSYCRYEKKMTNIFSYYYDNLTSLKLVFLNLPGQAYTFFTKKSTFNNIYYTEFLDRFMFNLMEKNYFDHTYHVVFVGFGNGGHIALTYASYYEKYWDFIHSIVLFNSYSENDDFINKSMLEILKNIETTNNSKLVDFFIKSITINPHKLLELESKSTFNDKRNDQFYNPITMTGYHCITKGYFYNIKINHNEIQTPIIVIHSNQNCFITFSNVNSLFLHKRNENYNVTHSSAHEYPHRNEVGQASKNLIKDITTININYEFDEVLPNSQIRRKLIVIDGSHDIINENENSIDGILHSYMKFMIHHDTFGSK